MDIFKIKKTVLGLKNLKDFVSREILHKAIFSDLKQRSLEKPESGRVLVLAPHPDDDVMGCGGTLKLHADQGDEVKIVYLTDGSSGFPENFRPSSAEKVKMAKDREDEAKKAAAVLGVGDLVFLKYKDGSLSPNSNNVKYITQLIKDYEPSIIYIPSFLDTNSDHFETAKILSESLRRITNTFKINSYEVWSPIFANLLINIDKSVESKEEALSKHKTQLKSRSYVEAILGLNKYRAQMFGHGKFAEAFFACNSKIFVELFDLYDLKK
ncbi:MAG: PIG-L family deacetylase [Candidatus Berkelbacteria bacterium]|nr:PIG-L family deacetylase [Candidatus Berkelbacteria bacterium]